jgi:hypothetical protein
VDLRAFLEDKLIAKAGRAEAARQRTEERSRALRARIREKAEGLCAPHSAARNAGGHRSAPHEAESGIGRTIRDELEEMRAESGNFGTETPAPSVSNATYPST